MSRDEEVFQELYPKFKFLYDESIKSGFKPMEVFGIMLGIIAQQYQMYATKEEFVDFLTRIQQQAWPDENPPKKKPNLRIVQ